MRKEKVFFYIKKVKKKHQQRPADESSSLIDAIVITQVGARPTDRYGDLFLGTLKMLLKPKYRGIYFRDTREPSGRALLSGDSYHQPSEEEHQEKNHLTSIRSSVIIGGYLMLIY